ncbi:hypothetical protein SBA6_1070015 [Candidatus Sulfopaludibacter sp. SbA6]|nr:hypothetical protein SBA6_1070015 [Candidatus Sulfopaludibacter sp. SbA6]
MTIDDGVLRHLKELRHLEYLNLAHTNIRGDFNILSGLPLRDTRSVDSLSHLPLETLWLGRRCPAAARWKRGGRRGATARHTDAVTWKQSP